VGWWQLQLTMQEARVAVPSLESLGTKCGGVLSQCGKGSDRCAVAPMCCAHAACANVPPVLMIPVRGQFGSHRAFQTGPQDLMVDKRRIAPAFMGRDRGRTGSCFAKCLASLSYGNCFLFSPITKLYNSRSRVFVYLFFFCSCGRWERLLIDNPTFASTPYLNPQNKRSQNHNQGCQPTSKL